MMYVYIRVMSRLPVKIAAAEPLSDPYMSSQFALTAVSLLQRNHPGPCRVTVAGVAAPPHPPHVTWSSLNQVSRRDPEAMGRSYGPDGVSTCRIALDN